MMRAMMLEFPGDPGCDFLDRQYMLGDSLLVAPVFSFDGSVAYYLPPGRWTNFLTAETVDGPGWIQETHPYNSLPLMVRPGTVLPVGGRDDRPDYDYAEDIRLQVYELAEGEHATVIIPGLNGEIVSVFGVEHQGCVIAIRQESGNKSWQALLVNIHNVLDVQGGAYQQCPDGVLVTPAPGSIATEITIV